MRDKGYGMYGVGFVIRCGLIECKSTFVTPGSQLIYFSSILFGRFVIWCGLIEFTLMYSHINCSHNSTDLIIQYLYSVSLSAENSARINFVSSWLEVYRVTSVY